MAFLERENYPAALKHFEAALTASRKAELPTGYQLLHCADALWRLGRYKEAAQMIGLIPTESLRQAELATQRFTVLAEMSTSRGEFRNAISFAQSALEKAARLDPKSRLQAQVALIEAYSRADSSREALSVYRVAEDNAAKLSNPLDKAQFSLAISGAFLADGAVKEAEGNALSALGFFSKSGEPESQVKALWRLALISERMRNVGDAGAYAVKALDLLAGLAHNWDSAVYSQYVSRPDIKSEIRQLSALAER
jgi:tetratricopeptide (TPR) repeat protein